MAKTLKAYDLYQIYQSWIQNAGIFRCFFRSTNFVSLKHYPDFQLEDPATEPCGVYENIFAIIEKVHENKTIYLLDIPGEQGIQVAYFLQKCKALKPILTFNNILHPNGLNGTKSYISSLIGYGELSEEIESEDYLFVLDQHRYGEYTDDELRKHFNNQYEITEEDLPPIEMLRMFGYESLTYIHDQEIKEDVGWYLEYLENNGFRVIKKNI